VQEGGASPLLYLGEGGGEVGAACELRADRWGSLTPHCFPSFVGVCGRAYPMLAKVQGQDDAFLSATIGLIR